MQVPGEFALGYNLVAAQFSGLEHAGFVAVWPEGNNSHFRFILISQTLNHFVPGRVVAFQVNQFLVGQPITEVNLDSGPMTVILKGNSAGVNEIDGVKNLIIAGQMGTAKLGDIADVTLAEGPVTISRSDGVRSASITGAITDEDTQAVGAKIQERIDSIDMPPGVSVNTGGVFQQIAEGFQDIFLAMAVGIVADSVKLEVGITQSGLMSLAGKVEALGELNSVGCSLNAVVADFTGILDGPEKVRGDGRLPTRELDRHLPSWLDPQGVVEDLLDVIPRQLMDKANLVGVHEAGVAHHIAAIGQIDREH